MASYKTRSKTNSFGTRRTTTTSPNGGKSTYTTSMKTGTGRIAYSQKSDGTTYTTHTTRHADGSVTRRRETTGKPFNAKKDKGLKFRPSKKLDPEASSWFGTGLLVCIGIVLLLAMF